MDLRRGAGGERGRAALGVAVLVFWQMLPATLLTPAIRPYFVAHHAGNQHAMHAFMALNMVGAALLVPVIGTRAARLSRPRRLTTWLLALDAVLLLSLCQPAPLWLTLGLRTLEGAAHVGATSLLLSEAAAVGRRGGRAHAMGLAGAALMLSVALGSALGGQLLALGPRAPFVFGALIQALLALSLPWLRIATPPPPPPAPRGQRWALLRTQRALWVPLAAVFVGRFTVGCLVVTFALFVHHAHGGSDRAVGLLLSLITLPFALAMYPLSRLSRRLPAAAVIAGGGVGYALSLSLIPVAPYAALPAVMVLCGVTSAGLFAPTLCYAAGVQGPRKETAMALLNSAGALGMLLGPATAGVVSAVLGAGDSLQGYRAVFALAACAVVLFLLASARWLLAQSRSEALALSTRA